MLPWAQTLDSFSHKYYFSIQKRTSSPQRMLFSPGNKAAFSQMGGIFQPTMLLSPRKSTFLTSTFPFLSKILLGTPQQDIFSHLHPVFSPKDPFSHQKYHTCPPREVSLSHNCPLFSHVLVIFSQKYHISLGNWACASKKMIFSPRHTCFLQTTARFLPKRLDDKTKFDTCNQE